MTHDKVYEWFETYFPRYSEHTKEWFPNGRNSIRVRHIDGREYVFTYRDKYYWCFETVDSFIRRLKGDK